LDAGQLAMLLEGVDYTRVRRGLRWQPPSSERQTIDNGERA
jgi:hypothetical protein